MNKILLIGPQGSGKSTQAKLLAEFLKIPLISTGDILREKAEVDETIRQVLNEGHLVDDQTIARIVKDRLSKDDCLNGCVIDGYPRTLEQMRLFDPGFDKVFSLDVPEEIVVKRLMSRGRADDTLELIKRRLDLYYKQTEPLLDYYKKLGILINIRGLGDIETIQQDLRNHITYDQVKKSV